MAAHESLNPEQFKLYRGTLFDHHEIGDEITPHEDSTRGLVFATTDLPLAKYYANIGNPLKLESPVEGRVYEVEPIDKTDLSRGNTDVEFVSKRGFRVIGRTH